MQLKEITSYLESIAPSSYQEGYDNSGLIVGHPEKQITGAIICLDSTEAVVDEAIAKNANLIIAHHPIVFSGLKRFNGSNYVQRVVMKAIKHDIAIYAIHTNLDNVYHQGVNAKIAEKLGLVNTKILAPKRLLKKLTAVVPTDNAEQVRLALFEAGAGSVNGISKLSYATLGMGTQNGIGNAMIQMEVLIPEASQGNVLSALSNLSFHIPYDIVTVENSLSNIGAGMVGDLPKPMEELSFLKFLKKEMAVNTVKHTNLLGNSISRVALCGGAGGFLLGKAKGSGAQIFITSDYKYHEFFDADGQIIIADIGHYESEQFTIELLHEILSQKFRNFAPLITETNTNPVHYL